MDTKETIGSQLLVNLRGHGENHPTKKVLQNCCEKEEKGKFWLDRRFNSKRNGHI